MGRLPHSVVDWLLNALDGWGGQYARPDGASEHVHCQPAGGGLDGGRRGVRAHRRRYRLEQRVAVAERPFGDPDDGMAEALLRAETTVLRNVPDQEAALRLLAEVNQRTGTFAFCYPPAGREGVAVSTATMVSWYEPTFHWFAHAAMVQIVQAERWADVLAAELEAETAVSAHSGSGPRPEPDEMLDWLGYTWSRPEWGIGSDELGPPGGA